MLEKSDQMRAKQDRDALLQAWVRMVYCISHDLKTSLTALRLENGALEEVLPTLLDSYRLVDKNKLMEPVVSEQNLKGLATTCAAIEKNVDSIVDFLNLLHPYNKKLYSDESDPPLQLGACLQDILENYPLSDEQRSGVHLDGTYDFQFKGDAFFLRHLFFDLLDKALYRIKRMDKGEIHIWAEEEDNYFVLHFKDTAGGLDEKTLATVFNWFFAKRDGKIVPALGFCRLKWLHMGGDIVCNTLKDQYTDFVIKFPKAGLGDV